MKFTSGSIVFAAVLLAAAPSSIPAAPVDPLAPSAVESDQQNYFLTHPYCQHILAVDADGNALLPRVTRTLSKDGSFHYHAETEILAGEDTRGADFTPARLQELFDGKTSRDDEAIRNALLGRKQLYLYLDAIFKAIEREKPDEIVVHVHGGLNKICGAIEKTALISDDLNINQPPDHRIFYIGICWNSDLYPTYTEHLFSIREGLHQPGKALVTAPAMLLSDLGSAASRLPLNLINFFYQDAYTVNPLGFKRTQLAQTRIDQIRAREKAGRTRNSVDVSPARNERAEVLRRADAAQWLLTQPGKIATTFFLDWLGSEPWKNMLRRTRTMFERESEFIPSVTYQTAHTLAGILSTRAGKPVDADLLLDQLNATGRQGAVSFFCNQAQSRLQGGAKRPRITLIGHSMGSIVGCEVLWRFHQLTLDNVVFMGAACSINDFKTKIVPYLQEQNLRAELQGGFSAGMGDKLLRVLQSQGFSDEAAEQIVRQCDVPTGSRSLPKTRFYNLCLHDAVENGEKNPGEADVVQRGSLLTWIDVLYQKPESENDRTFGRWVNAILATDSLPADVVNRITIKEFGVDRPLQDYMQFQDYAYRRGNSEELQEPMHHGDFGRFAAGSEKETTNLAFWRSLYRMSEQSPTSIPATLAVRRAAIRPASKRKGGAAKVGTAVSTTVSGPTESASERNARTGF